MLLNMTLILIKISQPLAIPRYCSEQD